MQTNTRINEVVRPTVKTEKVPMKLSPEYPPEKVPLTETGLKKPVVVLVSDGEFHRQITIHHPIGKTDLDAGAWVVSPSEEIKATLSRAEDPSREKKEKAVVALRKEHAIATGHYTRDAGGVVYCKVDPGKTFSGKALVGLYTSQKEAYAVASKRAKEDYILDCDNRRTKPKKDWKFGVAIETFLAEDFKAYERDFSKIFEVARKDEIALIKGRPYLTLCGPLGERKQVAMATGQKVLTSGNMVDTVSNTVIAIGRGRGAMHLEHVEVVAAFNKCGDDPKALKELILKLYPALG